MGLSFESSVAVGLRVEGSEESLEGRRHRRRYQFFAMVINRLQLPRSAVVLDHGCGAGYGCKIISGGTKAGVVGFDPDVEAVCYAREHHWWDVLTTMPEGPLDVIVTTGVLEHIAGVHPGDRIAEFLTMAPHVIGSVPYRELPGENPHHLWFGLEAANLFPAEAKVRTWYESCDEKIPFIEGPRVRSVSFFESRDVRDSINILFHVERQP